MAKPKKKSTKKAKIEWATIVIGGLVDLIVGTLLLLIDKMIK